MFKLNLENNFDTSGIGRLGSFTLLYRLTSSMTGSGSGRGAGSLLLGYRRFAIVRIIHRLLQQLFLQKAINPFIEAFQRPFIAAVIDVLHDTATHGCLNAFSQDKVFRQNL